MLKLSWSPYSKQEADQVNRKRQQTAENNRRKWTQTGWAGLYVNQAGVGVV